MTEKEKGLVCPHKMFLKREICTDAYLGRPMAESTLLLSI